MRSLICAFAAISTGVGAQTLDLQAPAGFDGRLWTYMTRDQKIELVAAMPEARAAALSKDSTDAATNAVRSTLKDPESAQFRGVKRLGLLNYCGWVNAKNGFGGYGGYSLFFANARWTIIVPTAASDPSLGIC